MLDWGDVDLASHDLFEWHKLVQTSLPAGSVGMLCRDSTPNDGQPADPKCDGVGAYVVKIWWVDNRNAKDPSGNAADLFRFSTEFQI